MWFFYLFFFSPHPNLLKGTLTAFTKRKRTVNHSLHAQMISSDLHRRTVPTFLMSVPHRHARAVTHHPVTEKEPGRVPPGGREGLATRQKTNKKTTKQSKTKIAPELFETKRTLRRRKFSRGQKQEAAANWLWTQKKKPCSATSLLE